MREKDKIGWRARDLKLTYIWRESRNLKMTDMWRESGDLKLTYIWRDFGELKMTDNWTSWTPSEERAGRDRALVLGSGGAIDGLMSRNVRQRWTMRIFVDKRLKTVKMRHGMHGNNVVSNHLKMRHGMRGNNVYNDPAKMRRVKHGHNVVIDHAKMRRVMHGNNGT